MSTTKPHLTSVNFFTTLLFSAFLSMCFQSTGQVTEKNYRIFSVKQNKEVPLSSIIEDMKNFDVLFCLI